MLFRKKRKHLQRWNFLKKYFSMHVAVDNNIFINLKFINAVQRQHLHILLLQKLYRFNNKMFQYNQSNTTKLTSNIFIYSKTYTLKYDRSSWYIMQNCIPFINQNAHHLHYSEQIHQTYLEDVSSNH